MLAELYVENFALIEHLQIEFHSGLNVISGETGAGKSLLTDAVGLVIGKKGDKSAVRKGTDRALVEATFTGPFCDAVLDVLEDINPDDDIIITREIHSEGKSICRINRRRVSLATIESLGKCLLNQHNQMDQAELLKPASQGVLLDRYGGEKIFVQKSKTAVAYRNWHDAVARKEEVLAQGQNREQRIDYLSFQKKDLEKLNLRQGEMPELQKEVKLLQSSTERYEKAKEAYGLLYQTDQGSAIERVYDGLECLKHLACIDENAQPLVDALNDAYFRLDDVVGEIDRYISDINADPYHFEEVQSRLATLERACKKYSTDENGLIRLLEEINAELAVIEDFDFAVSELEKAEKEKFSLYISEAETLHNLRKTVGESLQKAVTAELQDLRLPNAVFCVDVSGTSSYTAYGNDKIEYLISMNSGENLQPLAKVASGGEISRILLALKVVLAKLDNASTIVFDEIDSGLGGKTASAVGDKLAVLAQEVQVLAVTHSPIVAACADHHFYIEKKEIDGRTKVFVELLNEEGVRKEIARMLSGNTESAVSLAQADDLLNSKKHR